MFILLLLWLSCLFLFNVYASQASGGNTTRKLVVPNDVLRGVAVYLAPSERVNARAVSTSFAENLVFGSNQSNVISALRYLEECCEHVEPDDEENLRLLYNEFRFNELFLLYTPRILKHRNNHATNTIRGLFHLPPQMPDRYPFATICDLFHLPLSVLDCLITEFDFTENDDISNEENIIIMLSKWMMFAYDRQDPIFNGCQIFYQFLWNYVPSLPPLQTIYESKQNVSRLRELQEGHQFVIWHPSLSVPVQSVQNALDLYEVGLGWLWNVAKTEQRLNSSVLIAYMTLLMDEKRPLDAVHFTDAISAFFGEILLRQATFGEMDDIDLLFHVMQKNNRLYLLEKKYTDIIFWYNKFHVSNYAFMATYLKYVAPRSNQTEIRCLTDNVHHMLGWIELVQNPFQLPMLDTFINLTKQYWNFVGWNYEDFQSHARNMLNHTID
eukprot:994574_1